MVEGEWFLLQKDADAVDIYGIRDYFGQKYSYFMDDKAFQALDDGTALYSYDGRKDQCDLLFQPTFMISDRLQQIFHYLEPKMEFKALHLIDMEKKDAPAPLYWIPYLAYEDALHGETVTVQGRSQDIVLRKEYLEERRILHCRLPAEDLWLFSLEAAECLLRRAPVGVWMRKVSKII